MAVPIALLAQKPVRRLVIIAIVVVVIAIVVIYFVVKNKQNKGLSEKEYEKQKAIAESKSHELGTPENYAKRVYEAGNWWLYQDAEQQAEMLAVINETTADFFLNEVAEAWDLMYRNFWYRDADITTWIDYQNNLPYATIAEFHRED